MADKKPQSGSGSNGRFGYSSPGQVKTVKPPDKPAPKKSK